MADRDLVPHSWDGNAINDSTNYNSGFEPGAEWGLPAVAAARSHRTGQWPVISAIQRSGRDLHIWVELAGSDKRTLRDQLLRWFDPESESTANFVVKDEDGTNQRYVTAVCTQCVPAVSGKRASRDLFYITLAVHGDVRWRSTSASTDSWSITASGQTKTVTNNGNDDAYPIITIEPTSAKSGSSDYTYQRFVAIRWRVDDSATSYPVDIADNSLDTDALVTASKMQADGDDLRVKVDGTEVDRWLQDINTVTTQVWVNLDWSAKWEGTITAAITAIQSVTEITVNEATDDLPSEGLVCINSEIFSYTAKNDSTKTLTIGERAAKASTAAAHSASDVIWWVQHDISILYGNAGASAPSTDDDYKPIFELDSTNTSWDYDNFGEDDGLRTAAWTFSVLYISPTKYTANRNTNADPWSEMGIYCDDPWDRAQWRIDNPCGITAANFANGEKQASNLSYWHAHVRSWDPLSDEDHIAVPSSADTWEAWSDNETLDTGATAVGFDLNIQSGSGNEAWLEVSDVTLTLNSSNTPDITIHAEQTSYSLAFTLKNTTTGESVSFDYSNLDINETVTIDTNAKTVTDDQDGTSQLQALALVEGPRRDWFKLSRGSNTWEYTDPNTQGIDIDIEFEQRFH